MGLTFYRRREDDLPCLEALTGWNLCILSQVSVKAVRASARRYKRMRLARRSLDGLRRSLASPILIALELRGPVPIDTACGNTTRSVEDV